MRTILLTLLILALGALLTAQNYQFHINSFDVLVYDSSSPPPDDSPLDLQAEILFNGEPFSPPIHTPYLFGAAGNIPFAPGVYSVALPGWANWFPESLTFVDIVTDYQVDFLGQEIPPNVEITSFEAVEASPNDVQLTWVSQFETEMNGYYIYRGASNSLPEAQIVSPLVPATNTSQPQTYQFHDLAVETGNTYYWLEAIDLSGFSSFFGPVSVFVNGTEADDGLQAPPLESSRINKIWPNPGKLGSPTRADVFIKGPRGGSLTICNQRGQAVRAWVLGPGTHQVVWDGLDNRGQPCPGGIYLYRLSTPSSQSVGKLTIVK